MRTIICLVLAAFLVSAVSCVPKKDETKNSAKPAAAKKSAGDAEDVSVIDAKGLGPDAAKDYYYLIYLDALRRNRAQDAVTALTKLMALDPKPDFYGKLAELYWKEKDQDKARAILAQGLVKYPGDKTLRLYVANADILQQRWDDAIKGLRDLSAQYPDDQNLTEKLAAALADAKRFQETIDLVTPVPKDKRTTIMLYAKAQAEAGLNDTAAAMATLKELTGKDPKFFPAWATLGALYGQKKDDQDALGAYQKMAELQPDNKTVWLGLIQLSLRLNDQQAALDYLDKAPEDDTLSLQALRAFAQVKNDEIFAKAVQILGAKSPDNPDLIFIQAEMAWKQGKNLDEIMALLARVPKDKPEAYAKSLSLRTQLALENNRFDLAQPLIDEGKKMFPKDAASWLYQAALYERQNKLPEAVKVYKEAQAKWPSDPQILYRLALALWSAGDQKEGLEAGEKLLALSPNDPDAQNFVGYSLAEQGQNLDRAQELITKAVTVKPDNPYYQDSLAWLFYKRGDMPKAWEAIQKAVAAKPNQADIWEHYGDIAKAMNLPKEAAAGYAKALTLDPDNPQKIKAKFEGLHQ